MRDGFAWLELDVVAREVTLALEIIVDELFKDIIFHGALSVRIASRLSLLEALIKQ